jgi:hypothetical protein
MTNRGRRLAILVPACVLALVAAGHAAAAVTPSFWATTSAAGSAASYSQAASDDSLGSLTFYVPSGFTALLAQPEGSAVGTVKASGVAADSGTSAINLTGAINAATATTSVSFGGSTQTVGALATSCTGTPVHSAYWVLNLSGGGQTVQVPAFVDDVPLTSPLSDLANDTIKVCFAPPDVPAGSPGRSPSGLRFTGLEIVPNAFSVPPGWYVWHALAIPFVKGAATLNTAGAVEAQSVDRTPQSVTLKGKAVKGKRGTVAVTGAVIAGGKGIKGATVSVQIGTKVVGKATTGSAGTYRVAVKLPGKTAMLTATAVHPSSSAGSCSAAFPPVPCSVYTWGTFQVSSPKVRVHA